MRFIPFLFCVLACICASAATLPLVSLSPATLAVRENSTATLQVVLNEIVDWDVTGCYRTLQTSAATGSQDYVEVASGEFTIPAGCSETTIQIETIDDSYCELVEYFTVEIYEITSGGTLSTSTQSYVGIIDDEPGISISGGEADESSKQAVFNVTMSCAPAAALTISYSTQQRTARSNDYEEVTDALMQVLSGEYWRPIIIVVEDDEDQELRESFAVTLTGSSDGTIVTETAEAFIPINDWPVITTVASLSTLENATQLEIEIILGTKSPFPVTAAFATVPVTAKEFEDFIPTVGIITFLPFITTARIEIIIVNDPIYEHEEKFALLLYDPTNAIINGEDGLIKVPITIVDDDPVVRIAEDQQTAWYEGDTGVIVLVLEAPAPYDFTVNVSTTTQPDDTAMPNLDYVFVPLIQVQFFEGDTEANFSISMMNDLVEESNETFAVTLVASNATTAISTLGLTVMDVPPEPSPTPAASSPASPSASPSPVTLPASPSSIPASPSPSSSPSSTSSAIPSTSTIPSVGQPAPVSKGTSVTSSAAVTGTAYGVGAVGIVSAGCMGFLYIRNKRKMEDLEP